MANAIRKTGFRQDGIGDEQDALEAEPPGDVAELLDGVAAEDQEGEALLGEGEDIVAQLGVGEAAFWVASAAPDMGRFSPKTIGAATTRTLLVADDPDAVMQQALGAGAAELSPVADEHGWRVGRIIDPSGHEWEIGKPIGPWPPTQP